MPPMPPSVVLPVGPVVAPPPLPVTEASLPVVLGPGPVDIESAELPTLPEHPVARAVRQATSVAEPVRVRWRVVII